MKKAFKEKLMKVSVYVNAAVFKDKAGIIALLSDKRTKRKKLIFHCSKISDRETALSIAIFKALKELKKPDRTEAEINLPENISLSPQLNESLKKLKKFNIKINSHARSLEKMARIKLALTGITQTLIHRKQQSSHKNNNLPARKIKSYLFSLEEKGFSVDVTILEDNPDHAEAEIDIYDENEKLVSAQTITADINSYSISCHRCPLPSRCPFYGRSYCHESTLH